MAYGAFAGVGASWYITNAKNAKEIAALNRQVSIDAGKGVPAYQGSFSYNQNTCIWQLSLPTRYQVGWGYLLSVFNNAPGVSGAINLPTY